MLQRKIKAGSLLDRINCVASSASQPDEFTLYTLRRDADRWLSMAPGNPETYISRGAVAALEGDAETAHDMFHCALERFGYTPYILLNYSVTLERLGLLQEACDYALAAHTKAPDDEDILNRALMLTIHA